MNWYNIIKTVSCYPHLVFYLSAVLRNMSVLYRLEDKMIVLYIVQYLRMKDHCVRVKGYKIIVKLKTFIKLTFIALFILCIVVT